MKLVFEKKEGDEIEVKIRKGMVDQDFSYVELIKSLRDKDTFEGAEYGDAISQEDKDKLDAMLRRINDKVTEQETGS